MARKTQRRKTTKTRTSTCSILTLMICHHPLVGTDGFQLLAEKSSRLSNHLHSRRSSSGPDAHTRSSISHIPVKRTPSKKRRFPMTLEQINHSNFSVGTDMNRISQGDEQMTKFIAIVDGDNLVLPMLEQSNTMSVVASSSVLGERNALMELNLNEMTLHGRNNIVEATLPSLKDSTDSEADVPTVGAIMKFAIPAMGVWLCGPILSLIDTSMVGLFSGTDHQAALSVSVAVTDKAALLLAFLFAATTNLVSSSNGSSSTENVNENDHRRKVVANALRLSTWVGTGLGAALYLSAGWLCRALMGGSSSGAELLSDNPVLSHAVAYVRVRALGMPAAALLGTTQAVCLGLKDNSGPLAVLAVASLLNLVGDWLWVPSCGAAGAAFATTLSQVAAVLLFLRFLSDGFRSSSLESESEAQSQTTKDSGSFSSRGFLGRRFRMESVLQWPDRQLSSEFWPYVVPVTTTSVGRVSSFLAMAHVVGSAMGTIGLAAQQIVMSIFEALCPVVDSLSLTAQAIVPSVASGKATRRATRNFLKVGGIFGALLVAATLRVPSVLGAFTSDPLVISQVVASTPYLAAIFGLHGMVMAMEGVLLGRRDLNFLGVMYGIFFAVVPAFFLRVKHAILHKGQQHLKVPHLWKLFFGYEISRSILWVGRALWLSQKMPQDDKSDSSPATRRLTTKTESKIGIEIESKNSIERHTVRILEPTDTSGSILHPSTSNYNYTISP